MRINLYGGPGSGKSTCAASVFAKLKMLGVPVELVAEYIKLWAYEKRKVESFDQVYIFAKQQRREDRLLRAKVQVIVSDSPLYLQCMYAKRFNAPGWEELINLARKFEEKYSSINLLLKRHNGRYDTGGRYQSKDEALQVDTEIREFLDTYKIPYIEVLNDPQEIVVLALHQIKDATTLCTD